MSENIELNFDLLDQIKDTVMPEVVIDDISLADLLFEDEPIEFPYEVKDDE